MKTSRRSKIKSAVYGHAAQTVDVTVSVLFLARKCGDFPVSDAVLGCSIGGHGIKELVVTFEDGRKQRFPENSIFAYRKLRTGRIRKVNLAYSLFPLAEVPPVWKWHLQMLKRYADWIEGRRVIAMPAGGEYAPIERVSSECERIGFRVDQWIMIPDSSTQWEHPGFPHLLAAVASREPSECTFYAQSVGSERGWNIQFGYDPRTLLFWAAHLYLRTFARRKELLALLAERPLATAAAPGTDDCCITRMFFAFRHDALFSLNWNAMEPGRYWPEHFGSHLFPSDTATKAQQLGGVYDTGFYPYEREGWDHCVAGGRVAALPEEVMERIPEWDELGIQSTSR